MRDVSGARCGENKNTHFMCNNFFPKLCCLRDNVQEYFAAGQATDENMAHGHCILDT